MKRKNRQFDIVVPKSKKRKLLGDIFKIKTETLELPNFSWNSLSDCTLAANLKMRTNEILIAEEVNKNGAKNFQIVDVAKLIRFFRDCIIKKQPLFFHEVLLYEKRTFFFVDVDLKYNNYKNMSVKKLNAICNDALILFKRVIQKRTQKTINWIEESSTYEKKFSVHLKSRDLCFSNNINLGLFVVEILKDLLEKKFDQKRLFLHKIIDLSVYDKNHTIRMLYNSKFDQPKRKFFMEKKSRNFDEDDLKQSILTNVPKKKVFIHYCECSSIRETKIYRDYQTILQKNGYESNINLKNNHIRKNYGLLSKFNTKKSNNQLVWKKMQPKNIEKNISDVFLKNLKKIFPKCDLVLKKRDFFHLKVKSTNKIHGFKFYLKGNFCPLDVVDHRHSKSNGRYGIYFINSQRLSFGCTFNPKCKVKQKFHIDNFVLKNIDLFL